MLRRLSSTTLLLLLAACGSDSDDTGSAASRDTGTSTRDTGRSDADDDTDDGDTATADTGAADTGAADTGAVDTGAVDTGAADTGAVDTGAVDTTPVEDTSVASPGDRALDPCGGANGDCPAGLDCINTGSDGEGFCMLPCGAGGSCDAVRGEPAICALGVVGNPDPTYCVPLCESAADCPSGISCKPVNESISVCAP
jgi:hypothetical protein